MNPFWKAWLKPSAMSINNVITILLVGFLLWRLSQMLIGKVAPAKAKELVSQGALLLDVRTPSEFNGGHLPNAKNVPVQILAERLGELPEKTRPIVVYCASGMRSASAASFLRRSGFTQVFDLGSIARWPST